MAINFLLSKFINLALYRAKEKHGKAEGKKSTGKYIYAFLNAHRKRKPSAH